MDDPKISKGLIEAFRPIMEMNNARFRQIKTMLAGFIAMQERELNYMDNYMDTLFDFMDPQSDTEILMREYCEYSSLCSNIRESKPLRRNLMMMKWSAS